MSDKATQLKAKLLKQKSKDVKKVSVKKKEKVSKTKAKDSSVEKKKIPKSVPNLSRVEKSGKEEDKLRKDLKKIMDDDYDIAKAFKFFSDQASASIAAENPDTEDISGIVKETWDGLDAEVKREFALKVLAGKKEQAWGVPGLLQKLLRLPPDLQEDFIARYLERNKNYDAYYETWSQSPDVKEKIREFNEKRDLPESTKMGEVDSMKETLQQRAIQYANEHKIQLNEEEKSYYKILEQIIDLSKIAKKLGIDVNTVRENPAAKDAIAEKVQKLHQKLAKDYIDIAAALGAENPDQMEIGPLLSYIANNRKKLTLSVDVNKAKKIRDSSREKLVREASKIGIKDSSKLSDEILTIKLLQANVERKPVVEKKDLIEEARYLGIENPEDYEIISLKARVNSLRKQKAKEARRTKIIPSEKDRDLLADKLARITGKNKEYYASWTVDDLQQRYQSMEQGEEFWQEFERETVIDALTKLTNNSRQSYEDRETSDLVQELEILSEKRAEYADKVAETTFAKKCVSEFRTYKWIDAKVTGVWLAGAGIKKYTTKSYVSVAGKGKFHQANAAFFNLQCNLHSKKRFQEGNILTCFDSNNEPVKFEVGYSIQNGWKYNKIAWPILVAVDQEGNSLGKIRGNRLLIQNENLFQAEQDFLNEQINTISTKKKKLLLDTVTEKSIAIAKKSLSRTLLRLAPKVHDYELNSPYINIAVDSVVNKQQTNQDLFGIVANTIVYINLQKAEIFRLRIKEEYYLPDMLLKLSPEDKLPEVFDTISNVVSEKTVNIYTSYIRNAVNEIIDEMAESLVPLDPTARKNTRPKMFIEPTADVEYTKEVCINSGDNIRPENVVYYRDPADEKVYCLDIDVIAREFRRNNFINPHTQKLFDKDFIRRYTVTYFDSESGQTYVFPFSKLYKRLKGGNITNPETGKVFEKPFIEAIIKGSTWRESSALRSKQFQRLDRRLTMCRNPKNIEGAPLESIVYYKDPDDNSVYCFTIKQLSDIIRTTDKINPATNKKFSKRFVKRFQSIFSLSLHNKGINQPEFREIYGEETFKGITLPKEEKKAVIVTESEDKKPNLILPDLWQLVSGEFSNVKQEEENEQNDETTDEETEDETTEEEQKGSQSDRELEETNKESEESVKEPDKVSDKPEDSDKSEMGFSKSNEETCTACKNICGKECYKSIMMQDNIPKPCYFCSLKCMEKFHFPRFKKNKRNKK